MKNMIVRAVAGLLASILLVTGVALMGNMPNGKRTDSIFYDASGIHPDAALMTVNMREVPAEEYFYWLAYDCDYLTSYMGSVDFNAAISQGMSYGQYAMADAQRTVVLYSVVRAWAEQAGITLSEDSQAQLEAQRQQYVEYYGGEEGYANQLKLMGLTDEGFQRINEVYFLYSELYNAYCGEGGALRPAEEEIAAYTKAESYYTFLPLYWATSGEEAADAASLQEAQAAAERLRSASDVSAVYLQIAQEMALQATAAGETFSAEELSGELAAALSDLEDGQVSDVVVTDVGYYVLVGRELNTDAVLDKMFNAKLDDMRDGAGIRYNCRSYDKLNVGDFYTKLTTLRSQLQGNTGADPDTDTTPDSDADAAPDSDPQS